VAIINKPSKPKVHPQVKLQPPVKSSRHRSANASVGPRNAY
jgi:hypothetical protein